MPLHASSLNSDLVMGGFLSLAPDILPQTTWPPQTLLKPSWPPPLISQPETAPSSSFPMVGPPGKISLSASHGSFQCVRILMTLFFSTRLLNGRIWSESDSSLYFLQLPAQRFTQDTSPVGVCGMNIICLYRVFSPWSFHLFLSAALASLPQASDLQIYLYAGVSHAFRTA